jgi:molybdopterin-binding protein
MVVTSSITKLTMGKDANAEIKASNVMIGAD